MRGNCTRELPGSDSMPGNPSSPWEIDEVVHGILFALAIAPVVAAWILAIMFLSKGGYAVGMTHCCP
jgi:hypothetical protein